MVVSGYYTPLMSEHMSEQIDALRLARQGRTISAVFKQERMPRLGQYLHTDQDDVHVQVEFGLDGRLAWMRGTIRTELEMICQRCMEPMQQYVDISFQLGLVKSEAKADELPEGYEPLLVSAEPASLLEIVEDELILSLPIVAMHDRKDCPASEKLLEMEQEQPKMENPFAVLSALKKH
jgi:uncharacterized protein